ncbi:AraC family transcriptional regulator [Akkermansiaceae bacterium]|nr:AraC family transcriptional regulator [Akkermansiaceae bacterium]
MKHKINYPDFWEALEPGQITTTLMDMLSDTLVYVKNLESEYVYVNTAFTKTLQIKASDIIGKSDVDLFGKELASHYIQDDKKVMTSEKGLTGKAELVTYRPAVVKWYITSKIPLYNKKKEVVGLAGLSRPSAAHQQVVSNSPMDSLGRAVNFIYENKKELITVDMISEACGLSISTLERSFKKHISCSPGKFVTQVKVSNACELLAEPSYSINEVGYSLGYSDPAVFTRVFKREMKITPSAYRKSLTSYNND